MKTNAFFYVFTLIMAILKTTLSQQSHQNQEQNAISSAQIINIHQNKWTSMSFLTKKRYLEEEKEADREHSQKNNHLQTQRNNQKDYESNVFKILPIFSSLRILIEVQYCQQYDDFHASCILCQMGYILNGSSCISCGYQCKKCQLINLKATVCLQCYLLIFNELVLYKGKCYYQDSFTFDYSLLLRNETKLEVLQCPSSCLNCYLLKGTIKCYIQEVGFSLAYDSSSVIKPCKNKCHSCYQYDLYTCSNCVITFFLKNNQCERCSSQTAGKCKKCTYKNQFQCDTCFEFNFLSQNQCFNCTDNCIYCKETKNCLICDQGYVLYQPQFLNESKCVECIEGCKSCQFADTMSCQSCFDGHFLDSDKKCQLCSQNCKVCISESSCLQCQAGYQLFNLTKTKIRCRPLINRCLLWYTLNGTCVNCWIGYQVVNNECVFSPEQGKDGDRNFVCGIDEYLLEWQCHKSSNLIQNCIDYDQVGCTKCNLTYYLTYDNNEALTCLKCDQGCKECKIQSSICLSCTEGYFRENDDVPYSCRKCDFSCKTCTNQSNYCTSCYDNYTMNAELSCVSKFKIKFRMDLFTNYSSSLNVINQIKSSFKADITQKTQINTQNPPELTVQFTAIYKGPSYTLNISSDTGYYIKNSTIIEGYISYHDLNKITSIYDTLIKSNITDIYNIQLNTLQLFPYSDCPQNQSFNHLTNQCEYFTIANCIIYDSLSNGLKCNLCDTNMTLVEGYTKCVKDCSYEFPNCQTCSNDTLICEICEKGFMLSQNKKHCISCEIQNCSTCQYSQTGKILCLTCLLKQGMNETTDYKIIFNRCEYRQINLLEGIVQYGFHIIKCMQGCITCFGPFQCDKCSIGYYLSEKEICVRCPNDCKKCRKSSSGIVCEECYESFYFSQSSGSCKACEQNDYSCTKCPQFQYLNEFMKCVSCGIGCKFCNSSNCLNCSDGYFESFLSNGSLQCQKCVQGCLSCKDGVCTGCYPGFYLDDELQCRACNNKCWTCKSENQCTGCSQNFTLINSTCQEKIQNCVEYYPNGSCLRCYFGFQINQDHKCPIIATQSIQAQLYDCDNIHNVYTESFCNNCTLKDDNCIRCIGNLCLKCKQGFYSTSYQTNDSQPVCLKCEMQGCLNCLSSGICIECKDGYYLHQLSQNSSQGTCYPCDKNCLTCFNKQKQCTSCRQNFNLSSSRTCFPKYGFNFTMALPMNIQQFSLSTNDFIDFLSKIAGNNTQLNVFIKKIYSGSTILEGMVAGQSHVLLNSAKNSITDSVTSGIKFKNYEIMKVSLSDTYPPPEPQVSTQPSKIGLIIGIVVGATVLVIIIVSALVYICLIKNIVQQQTQKTGSSSASRINTSSSQQNNPLYENGPQNVIPPYLNIANNPNDTPEEQKKGKIIDSDLKIKQLQNKRIPSDDIKNPQENLGSSQWINPYAFI